MIWPTIYLITMEIVILVPIVIGNLDASSLGGEGEAALIGTRLGPEHWKN